MTKESGFLEKMKKEMSALDCCNVSSIEDISKKYSYEDDSGPSKRDRELVSCGQDGSYNELKHIYKSKLEDHVKNEAFSESAAIRALCEACYELDSPRKREDFYNLLSEKLGVDIK